VIAGRLPLWPEVLTNAVSARTATEQIGALPRRVVMKKVMGCCWACFADGLLANVGTSPGV